MSNLLSFYLDDSMVQAVNVSVANGMITAVHDVRSFPHEELGAYLLSRRLKTCILCCNPTFFYQDTFNLPPTASRFYENLIRVEVQKSHPDLQTFTFFYRTIGDVTIDGFLLNRVAVFSYTDDSLSEYISLFSRHGKTISKIYAAPYPIFKLAAPSCLDDPNTPRFVIASIPNEKMILLSMNGEPAFIRRIPSADAELHGADTENINMTIDYCFQSLRIRPAEALLLNIHESLTEPRQQIGIKIRLASLPPLAALAPDMAENFIAPLAAALHYADTPSLCDITPADYVTFTQGKKYLSVAIMVLFVISTILCGLILTERLAISDLKSTVAITRGQLAKAGEELESYRKLDDEAKKFGRPIEDLNKLSALISPAAALAPLYTLNSPACSLRQLSTQKGDGFIGVHLEGDLRAGSYGETQRIYEETLARLIRIPGYAINSSTVDINKKSFVIEARFSSGAGQSK